MMCVVQRAIRIAAALPLLWLGACGADSTGDTGSVGPGISNGTAGFGAQPMAGTGGPLGMAGTIGSAGIGGGASGIGGTMVGGMAGTSGMAGTGSMAGVSGTGGGMAGTGAMMAGSGGTDGMAGVGGMAGMGGDMAGTGGMAGMGGMAGTMAGTGGTGGAAGMGGGGACCSDGNCICREAPPSAPTANMGPYRTSNFRGRTGTIYYPTDAEPPFAGIALCGGFTNTGPEMAGWGPFYASHGIVTIITTTGGADLPDLRGAKLLASIEELKSQNMTSGSPLYQKMAGRYGTSGYSMGGGGTTIASAEDSTLKTSVGLAAWAPVGAGIQVPTLLLCGDADIVAPCSQSQGSYAGIPNSTPKMMLSVQGATHFSWFGPGDAGRGTSGAYALAFQKVFLEGDERWKPLLTQRPSNGTATTNIQ